MLDEGNEYKNMKMTNIIPVRAPRHIVGVNKPPIVPQLIHPRVTNAFKTKRVAVNPAPSR
jgi:hypothetical protein